MKCLHCNMCLLVVRIDRPEKSYLYRFCDICYGTYLMESGRLVPITDKNIIEEVKNKYFEKIRKR